MDLYISNVLKGTQKEGGHTRSRMCWNLNSLFIFVALCRFSSRVTTAVLRWDGGFGQKTEIAVHGMTIHSSDNIIALCGGRLENYYGEEGFKFTFAWNPEKYKRRRNHFSLSVTSYSLQCFSLHTRTGAFKRRKVIAKCPTTVLKRIWESVQQAFSVQTSHFRGCLTSTRFTHEWVGHAATGCVNHLYIYYISL